MKLKLSTLSLAIAAALASGAAVAADGPTVTFSGFGTLSAVHSDNKNVDFVGTPRQPNGVGYTRSTDIGVDSILGAQANIVFNKSLSSVVQVTSQRNHENNYTPALEWAFVKWQATPSLDLTIGRTALPAFALSDSRLVGYSYLWARPPIDVYYQVPLTNIDGVGATWRHSTALGELSLQGQAGKTNLKFPNNARIKGEKMLSAAATLESGPYTWRAGYTTAKLSYSAQSLDALVGGINQYGAGLAALGASAQAQQAFGVANDFAISDKRASFADLGVSYDKGNWLAQAEYTVRKGVSVIPDTRAWHASAGYRVGDFTPYLGASAIKTTSSLAAPQLAGSNPTANFINANLAGAMGTSGVDQNSATAGVKWNFRSGMDFKLQYDHIRFKKGTTGTFADPTMATGQRKAGLVTAAVDFVF